VYLRALLRRSALRLPERWSGFKCEAAFSARDRAHTCQLEASGV